MIENKIRVIKMLILMIKFQFFTNNLNKFNNLKKTFLILKRQLKIYKLLFRFKKISNIFVHINSVREKLLKTIML